MPTRYLKESICTSENLIMLSAEAERFFYRLIVNVDDFGRLDARPQVLRAKCFTMMEDRVSFADVDAWLDELRNAQLLTRYIVNGKPYLVLNTFTEHNKPRADKSKCPNPPANTDTDIPMSETAGNCTQVQADASKCLPIPSYSNTESNTKSGSTPANNPFPRLLQTAPSASAGRALATQRQAANRRVSAELLNPITNTLLDITGKRAAVDAGDDILLSSAQEKAERLYLMGYKTDAELLAIEEAWRLDYRGKNGGGTFQQFEEFASERKQRKNGKNKPIVDNELDWDADPQLQHFRQEQQHARQ